jgi:hypothetical protein
MGDDGSLSAVATALPLEHEWVWYAHYPCASNTYSKAYVEVGRFGTVADFWRHYNAIPSVDFIHSGGVLVNKQPVVAYSIFRSDIRPEWEDPRNATGSEWGCRDVLDAATFHTIWDAYLLGAVGNLIPHCVGVRAINKSNRNRMLHKLEVWMDEVDAERTSATRRVLQDLAPKVPKLVFIPHQIKQAQATEYQQRQRKRRHDA